MRRILFCHDMLSLSLLAASSQGRWNQGDKGAETQWLFRLKKKSFHYGRAPRGPRGVKKSHFFTNVTVFLLRKDCPQKTQTSKTIQIEEKMSKKPLFFRHFWIFFNLEAILAHQTSTGMFSGSWGIFDTPGTLGGRINSGDTRVLRFVLIILWQWCHLADFSLLWKSCPNFGQIRSRTCSIKRPCIIDCPTRFSYFPTVLRLHRSFGASSV